MTNATIPMEQRKIDALSELAASIGTSFEAMARETLVKLLEPECEPFESDEEAAAFGNAIVDEVFADETW